MDNKDNDLKLYPLADNEFIGSIWMDKANGISSSVQTLVLLDSSNSMGKETRRFVNRILPSIMSQLSYGNQDKIYLITFGRIIKHFHLTADGLKSLFVNTTNATRMAPAIEKLKFMFQRHLNANEPVRVLTISDGEISDGDETKKIVKHLIAFLDNSQFTINSQAVRLFTSNNQPDTHALSCLLQINNTTTSKLHDCISHTSDENIAKSIAALFQSDNFQHCQYLQFTQSIILKFPWNNMPSVQIILVPGWNVFWLKLVPTGEILFRNKPEKPIKVVMKDKLTLQMFQDLIDPKLDYIVDHMKILKIVGSYEANRRVEKIFTYFQKKENKLAVDCSISTAKNITNLLIGIAKDQKIKHLDSKQMAEYLQSPTDAERQRKKDSELRKKREFENEQKRTKELQEKLQAEERRKREDEEKLQKKLEAEERRRREDEEKLQLQKKLEAEERRKREDEEKLQLQKKLEAEEHRKREDEEKLQLQKKLEAEERRKREDEEKLQLQKKLEAEERRKREAEEKLQLQKKLEAEERRKREDEEKLQLQKKLEAEECRKRENEEKLQLQKKLEAEERRKREDEEKLQLQKKLEAEERRRREDEEKLQLQKKLEAEERRKREDEEKLQLQKKLEAEEHRKREDEEKFQLQKKLEAEERRKREDEEKLQLQKKLEAEERRKREAEEKLQLQKKLEAEERRKREDEEKLQLQKKLEAEERRKREDEEKLQLQKKLEAEERRRREDEEKLQLQKKLEAEERRKREDEEKLQLQKKLEAEEHRKREDEEKFQLQKKLEAEERRKREDEEKLQRQKKLEAEGRRKREAEVKLQQSDKRRKRETSGESRNAVNIVYLTKNKEGEPFKKVASKGLHHISENEGNAEKIQFTEKRTLMRDITNTKDFCSMETCKKSVVSTMADHEENEFISGRKVPVIIFGEATAETMANQNWRFSEKIIPLMLSKLSCFTVQLLCLLTFGKDDAPSEEIVESFDSYNKSPILPILQTLDVTKRILILLVTNGKVQDSENIQNFAESMVQFLGLSNYQTYLQYVRITSEYHQSFRIINTTNSNLVDIDGNESDEFIATRIVELLHPHSVLMYKRIHVDINDQQIHTNKLSIKSEVSTTSTAMVARSVNQCTDVVVTEECRHGMQKIEARRGRWRYVGSRNVKLCWWYLSLFYLSYFCSYSAYNGSASA